MAEPQISKPFPVKPKQKPKPRTPKQTPESKYWSSFKNHQTPDLIASVNSLTFSPAAPHSLAAAHSTTLSLHHSPSSTSKISLPDVISSASFRSDGLLIAAADLSGLVQVFDVKTRTPLRRLRSHTRPVRFVKFPRLDKLHLLSGGDDSVVKYWDVAAEAPLCDFLGHKDYVRCGDWSPNDSNVLISGSYDHTVKLWDVRDREASRSCLVMEINHGKPVEDVMYLPSGGMIATAGGDSVKIWDVIGGGRLVYSMESHNKTVTLICVGKVGKESGEEAQQYRILSVALDGYLKVFDYAKMRVTHSMRFPAPLMSVAFSPDCMTRVIGTSNGIIYTGRRKSKADKEGGEDDEEELTRYERRLKRLGDGKGLGLGLGPVAEEPRMRVLRPTNFRYFQRGQSEKPSERDYLVMRPKKVKLGEHDRLLKKFRHKEALVSVLGKSKNPENAVAVMEELVSRKKLLKCVSNLDVEELRVLLLFLQKHCTVPRYGRLLMGLTEKVVEMRAEDIRVSTELKGLIRNIKRAVEEEIRIQLSLQEIQGVISPLLRISGRR